MSPLLGRNARVRRFDARKFGLSCPVDGNAVDLCDPVRDRGPLDAEAAGELSAQLRLEQIPHGLGPPVEAPRIQRRPAPVVRGIDEIRSEHVGVKMRVAGPGRAVSERDGNEAFALVSLGSAPSPPTTAAWTAASWVFRTSFDASGSSNANSNDTDLGAQNVASYPGTVGAPWARVSRSPVAGSRASNTQCSVSASTSPARPRRGAIWPTHSPGCFLGAGVVLLGAGGDGPQVVLLLAGAELAETQHGNCPLLLDVQAVEKPP